MVAPDHGQLRASGLVSPDAQRDWPAGAGAAVPAAVTGTDLAAAAVRDFPRHGSVSLFLRARSDALCRHVRRHTRRVRPWPAAAGFEERVDPSRLSGLSPGPALYRHGRSEERRVGNECGRTSISWRAPYHNKT